MEDWKLTTDIINGHAPGPTGRPAVRGRTRTAQSLIMRYKRSEYSDPALLPPHYTTTQLTALGHITDPSQDKSEVSPRI